MTGLVLAVQLDYGPAGQWWYRLKDIVRELNAPALTIGLVDGQIDEYLDLGHRWSDSPNEVLDWDIESALITETGLRRLALRNGLTNEQQIRLMELIRDADHCVPRP